MKNLTVFCVIIAFLFTTNLYSTTYYVKEGASGTTGSSWADAFGTLQEALDAANTTGDEIWVAAGTYFPTSYYDLPPGDPANPRLMHFRMKNGVTIYGGFPATGDPEMGARDWATYETILSGDIGVPDNNSDNCYHVFYHQSGANLNNTAILDGFTITAGNANGDSPNDRGSGMYNQNCNPSVTNCTFSANNASIGGGMYNQNSSPLVTNCTFSANTTSNSGGGMFNGTSSSPSIINSTFNNNSALIEGGGMTNWESSPTITNCTFNSNSANQGGGMLNIVYSNPIISNCTFSNNDASYIGGGMNNRHQSSPTISNSIIWGNTATDDGNQFYINGGTTTLNYSCYANGTNDVHIEIGTFTVTNNNITDDPQFVGSGDHPYSLQPTSPCINTGSNALIPVGITTDIIGNPRILAGTVDMGAYEYSLNVSISSNSFSNICYDSPVVLVAEIGDVTVDDGEAPYTYSWSPSFLVEHTDPSSPVATLTRAIRDAVYTLTVTDANGMQGTATVSVETSPWVELPSLVVHRFHAEDIENPLNLYELVFGVGVDIDNYMNDLIYGEGEGDEIPQQPFTYCVRFVDRFTGDYFQNPSNYIPLPNSRQYLWVEVKQEGLQPPPNGGEGICVGCLVAKRRLNIVVRGNQLGYIPD